jgi:hypothetical protein
MEASAGSDAAGGGADAVAVDEALYEQDQLAVGEQIAEAGEERPAWDLLEAVGDVGPYDPAMAVVPGAGKGVQGVLDPEALAVGEAPGQEDRIDEVVQDFEYGSLDDAVLDVGDREQASATGRLGDLAGVDGVGFPLAGPKGRAEGCQLAEDALLVLQHLRAGSAVVEIVLAHLLPGGEERRLSGDAVE